MRFFPILLLFWSTQLLAQSNLYPVRKGELWGYINERGKIIIKPSFHAAKEFHGELAAVRQDGYYDFIDTTGRFIIDPVYDYVTPFHNGIAQVFVDGIPCLIDKAGKLLFKGVDYKKFIFLEDDKWMAQKDRDDYALIDKTGAVLFNGKVRSFYYKDGIGFLNNYDSSAAIDKNGNYIIPWGKYTQIAYAGPNRMWAYNPLGKRNILREYVYA